MKYIFGNWKMNNTSSEVQTFIKKFKKEKLPKGVIYGLAVPFPYIKEVAKGLDTLCLVGAENVCFAEKGAYTGEVSASMLADCKMNFCLVGHSERRQFFKETEAQINQKIFQLKNNGIIPVLCIGETEKEYKAGKTQEVLQAQLSADLQGVEQKKDFVDIMIAYEPVWLIGSGQTPTAKDIKKNFTFIKKVLKEILGENEIKVLYGGSVKSSNAKELLSDEMVDGALVGGASLVVEDFINIGRNLI